MTRRALLGKLANQEQSLPEVWGWYEFQRALLGEEKSRVLTALSGGTGPVAPRYYGKTREELDDDFAYQLVELGRLTMLGMLACTEAALRVDFNVRVKNRKKDDVSRRFRDIPKARKEKVRLEEDILDTWKERGTAGGIKPAIADFKGALQLRHWLAHGRYWSPKLGRAAGYHPVDVFDICKAVLQAVDLMPPDPAGP